MIRVIVLLSAFAVALALVSTTLPGLAGSGAEAQTSQTETLSGVLNVRWIDPPPDSERPHEVEFVLAAGGEKTDLRVGDEEIERAGGAVALNGKRVTVEGRGTPGERFVASSVEPGARTAASAQRAVTGSRPTVTILCRFSNSTSVTPHDNAWFEGLMGATNPGLDHYWREVSHGNMDLAGSTVAGWYNLPRPMSYYQTRSGYDEDLLARDCTRAADAEVSFPSYANVNLMFNANPAFYALGGTNTLSLDGQTKTYGMAWMPRFAYEPGSGVNGTGQVWLAHEMGHAFGLPHSSGPYSNQVYDSDWDPMSDGSVCAPPHTTYGCVGVYTTTYHMDRLLGWIPPSRKYTATSGPDQGITLEQLGTPGANGAYLMAQVPIPGSSTRFYTVEARRFAGYDDQVPAQAVVIHRVDTTRSDRNARVVDPDRNGDPNDAGARWLPGEVFEDGANGIGVAVTRASASGFNVTINPSGAGGDDPASPHVRSSTPSPGQARVGFKPTVTANFDDVMDQDTLTGSNVQLYRSGAGSPVGATVTPGADGRSVTLQPSSRLRAGKSYSVRLWRDAQGIEDLEGNALSGGGNYLVSETGGYVFWRFKVRS